MVRRTQPWSVVLLSIVFTKVGPSGGSGVVKVWDSTHPQVLEERLPVRAQAMLGGTVRIFEPDGTRIRDEHLCSAAEPGSIAPWAPAGVAGVPGICGDVSFSRDGSLALLLDASIRDGPSPYVRSFDPETGRFGVAESRPGAEFKWALGKDKIACFLGGETFWSKSSKGIRLEVVRRNGDALIVEPIWQDSTYKHLQSAAMNDAGTIVALMARNGHWTHTPLTDWALLVVPAGSTPSMHSVGRHDSDSQVAISENGRWIATSADGRGSARVEIRDAENLAGVESVIAIDDMVEFRSPIRSLSVSNHRMIAAIAEIMTAPGESEACVFLVRDPSHGEVVTAIGYEYPGQTAMRFFSENLLWVSIPGLPRMATAANVGASDRAIHPQAPRAFVFRLQD